MRAEEHSVINWHKADIHAAVRKAGSNMSEIGRSVGLKRQTMYWALIFPHFRANRAIADFLGVSLHEIWPQWFDADGKLTSRRPILRPGRQTSLRAERPSMPRRSAA